MEVHNGALTLNVVEDGDPNGPPVLLLHGITSSHRTWDWLVPELPGYRVLRLDFRGHGASSRAPDDYNPAGYVADAVSVLEQVGTPAAVVGHSLGGGTAAAVTQQRPDLLVAAVMEDPPLGTTTPGAVISLEGNALLDGFKLMRETIPRLQESGIPLDTLAETLAGAPDTTGAGTFGEMLHPDGVGSMAAGLLEVDATVLDAVVQGRTPAFLDPTVPFGVPSLVVTADPAKPDAIADPAVAAHYAAISPDVEVLTVAGAGHLIHDEKASRQAFLAAVTGFLVRHAPA